MLIDVYNQKGEKVGRARLPEEVFGLKMNEDLLHQAVVAQMANRRQVLAHTKDRGEVRGGGRKPWRQKGTGRARHGSIRSPIWRGGGVTFGPTKERVFAKKINKKMKRKALFIALSSKVRDKEMIVLDNLRLEAPKTKEMAGVLSGLFNKILGAGLVPARPEPERFGARATTRVAPTNDSPKVVSQKKSKKQIVLKKHRSEILLVLPQKDQDIQRASQNLSYAKIILADSLNVIDVLKYRYLVVLKDAVKIIMQHYTSKSKAQMSNKI